MSILPAMSLINPQALDIRKHCMVIISGGSGAGKDTMAGLLLKNLSLNLVKTKSATTRLPRSPEEEANPPYEFITRDQFKTRLDRHEFLEHNDYAGNHSLYGTLISNIAEIWSKNKIPLLIIDTNGCKQILKHFQGHTNRIIRIFLKTDSPEDSAQRIKDRKMAAEQQLKNAVQAGEKPADNIKEEAEIQARIQQAIVEEAEAKELNYQFIINHRDEPGKTDKQTKCAEEIANYIIQQKSQPQVNAA